MNYRLPEIIFTLFGGVISIIIFELFIYPIEDTAITIVFDSLEQTLTSVHSATSSIIDSETSSIWGIDDAYNQGLFVIELAKMLIPFLPGGILGYFISFLYRLYIAKK